MKTVFDPNVSAELRHRVQALSNDSKAHWGKMNAYQMIRHCTTWNDWVLGKGRYAGHPYKQDFLGKIFGKWALKSNTQNEKPIGKGMPAGRGFVIKEKDGDAETLKTAWIAGIKDYAHFSNDRFVHDFFGKMTKEQIRIFVYKHFDHHLRQFGV